MILVTGIGWVRRIARNPRYGLRGSSKRYKRHDSAPAGPTLVSRRRQERRPYSERAHARRVRFARFVLLVVGACHVLVGAGRALLAPDVAAAGSAVAGGVLLVLWALSRSGAPAALWGAVLLYAAFTAATFAFLSTWVSENPRTRGVQLPFTILTIAAMGVVLVTLLAGAWSASTLERRGPYGG